MNYSIIGGAARYRTSKFVFSYRKQMMSHTPVMSIAHSARMRDINNNKYLEKAHIIHGSGETVADVKMCGSTFSKNQSVANTSHLYRPSYKFMIGENNNFYMHQ